MTSKQVKNYLEKSAYSPIRPELEYALGLSKGGAVAIDCGCGAGSNIAHLRARGFSVHAFDIDEQAIAMCADRFADDSNVILSVDSFGSFSYPTASIVVADASLFFCPVNELKLFVEKIVQSLQPQGVFYGAFLGARDTMASSHFNTDAYWGEVMVLSAENIKNTLSGFDIVQFKEHESDGVTTTGDDHHWHILSVVANISSKVL